MIHITIKYMVSDKGKEKKKSVLRFKDSTIDSKVFKEAKWSYWNHADRRNPYLFLKDIHINANAIIDKDNLFKPLKLYL